MLILNNLNKFFCYLLKMIGVRKRGYSFIVVVVVKLIVVRWGWVDRMYKMEFRRKGNISIFMCVVLYVVSIVSGFY